MIRKVFCVLGLGLALLPLSARATDVATPGGTVSLTLPTDFTALSAHEIRLKFGGPEANLPVAVYGNASRGSTIAVSWSQTGSSTFNADSLGPWKDQLHDMFTRQLPGLHWIADEIRPVNGKNWIFLENTTPARQQGGPVRVHNEIFCTDLKGNMLLVNLNSTEVDFAHYSAAFKTAAQSLRVKESTQAR
jgi:hypothetical protein